MSSSGPPVRSDYERALERIKELEADVVALRSQRQVLMDSERTLNEEWSRCEEERLYASTRASDLELSLNASLAREDALNLRLSTLDTLAREITERVEKMASTIDKR